jgi:hypothetical protein
MTMPKSHSKLQTKIESLLHEKIVVSKMDLLIGLLGTGAGVGTGKAEEYYHEHVLQEKKEQYRKNFNWTAIFPAVIVTGGCNTLAEKYTEHKDGFRLSGIFSLTYGGGVLLTDLWGLLYQRGMLWQRKDFLPPGHAIYEEIPAGTKRADVYKVFADKMAGAIWRGHNDPTVRKQALEIIQKENLDGRDWVGCGKAIQQWVKDNITYVYDGKRVEWFSEAEYTLRTKAEDCDGQTILMSSLLNSIGIPTVVIFLSQNRNFEKRDPEKQDFQHVLCGIKMQDETIYPLETIIKDQPAGELPYWTGILLVDMATPNYKILSVKDGNDENDKADVERLTSQIHGIDDRVKDIKGTDVLFGMPITDYIV